MSTSLSKTHTVSAGLRAHAEAGLSALWHRDARAPDPSDTLIVFDGKAVCISDKGKDNPFDAATLENSGIRSVDLIFKGPSSVDLEAVVPAGPRERTILNCEDMIMEQSPFPEEACLCFWKAHWKGGSWHVTASVTLAKPVLNVLDMLKSSGIKVRSVRRKPQGNAPEWMAVPPWIRPPRQRLPRIPVWGLSLAAAILLFAGSFIATSSMRATALEAAEQSNRVDRALIARMATLSQQRNVRRLGQAVSQERIALIGLVAQALPDTVSLNSFSIDGKAVQIEGRGGTAADALRAIAAIDGLTDARLAGDVQRGSSGEVFSIEAVLEDSAS